MGVRTDKPLIVCLILFLTASILASSCIGRGITQPDVNVVAAPSSTIQESVPMETADPLNSQPSVPLSEKISDPYCNPPNTGIWLVASSTILQVGQDFEVDLYLKNDEASEAFLGQIQYRLSIPPNIDSMDLDPVDSTFTLYPGDSERVTFRFQARSEGVAFISGEASYELHALDFSWGSWTGCTSHPLELEVVPGAVGTNTLDQGVLIHHPSTQTMIPEVDDVLDSILVRDEGAIKALIDWTESACTHATGLGGPPKCREGEQEGALVEVLPFLGPEGYFLRREDQESWSSPSIKGIYAVYRVSSAAYTDRNYPAGDYGLVFLHGHGVSFITFRVVGGRIVRIDTEFGFPPDDHLLRDAEEILLSPPPG
jgi:hypothetical protein